jgi:O-antigen/teichoic acid export membrane protein
MGSQRVGEEILAVARLATLVAVPIAATFVLRGESFISLWMGSQFGPASGEVLRILAIVVWLEAPRSVVMTSLTGMSKQRMLIPGIAAEAACKVALSILLVGPLGIVGVAIGTLIPSLLVNLGYIPRCLAKAAGVPVRLFHWQAVLLPTLACVPFLLASVALERFVPARNLAVFFVQVISILPLVALGGWFLCLTTDEKQQVSSQLRRLVGG